MSYSTQTSSNSDIWAVTTDLTTLRQKLLDLFCQLAYQEGDFVPKTQFLYTNFLQQTQIFLKSRIMVGKEKNT